MASGVRVVAPIDPGKLTFSHLISKIAVDRVSRAPDQGRPQSHRLQGVRMRRQHMRLRNGFGCRIREMAQRGQWRRFICMYDRHRLLHDHRCGTDMHKTFDAAGLRCCQDLIGQGHIAGLEILPRPPHLQMRSDMNHRITPCRGLFQCNGIRIVDRK